MQAFFSKILTYIFVFIIYIFIYVIIRMIFSDIQMMYKKKTGGLAEAYLKLINLRSELDFPVEESYEIEDNEIIGRGKKSSIVIPDRFLSLKNSRIFKSSGKFYIEDLGSTNGTYLNGTVLEDTAVELLDGDKIRVGRVTFLFVIPAAVSKNK